MVPWDGKYWWCTYACKIIYVVKHLLAHTALGGLVSQSCALSDVLLLTKPCYFIFIMDLCGKEQTPAAVCGRKLWYFYADE